MNARRRMILALAVASGLTSGCDRPSGNLSPTPDLDPDRHARALLQAAEVSRLNREAEARFYRRGRAAPPLEAGADPDGNALAVTERTS